MTMTTQPRPKMTRLMKTFIIGITFYCFITTLMLVSTLGSLQQVYKQVNTLTEFTANCIMNPKESEKDKNKERK